MKVGLLGPLRMVGQDGGEIRVAAPKERAALTVLGLRVGVAVGIGELIDALWGDDPPISAAKAVRTYVSSLRRVLPPGSIDTVGRGYRLKVDPDGVDLFVFEGLAAAGREALMAGDAHAAVESLRGALGLWRGEPLEELVDQAWGAAEATRLVEGRRNCVELLGEARLALGEAASLVGDFEAAVAAEPLRERRWAQLMLALYRAGRQAEALRAFQRLRGHLADQLGIEPSAELRALEEAILLQKPELDGPTPSTPLAKAIPVRPVEHSQAPTQTRRVPALVESTSGTGGLVTFVFTDIEGSTRLWEQYPDRMTSTLERHDRLVRDTIAAGGGRVFKLVGDAVHAVFGSPTTALRAALAVQADVAAAEWGDIGGLALRIGVYTGEAELVDGEWRGRSLSRCARLRDDAAGGQILASHGTIELVGDDLADLAVIISLGPRQLHGMTRREEAHLVQARPIAPGAGPKTTTAENLREQLLPLPRPLVRAARRALIGRHAEIERVTRHLSGGDGDIRVVLVAGEPGVGKSRLAAAAADHGYKNGALVLYGRCDEGVGVPYQPFVEALGEYIDAIPPARLAAQLGSSGHELGRLLTGLGRRLAGLSPPTTADPNTERWLLFQAATEFLRSIAAEHAVLLVVDDLHWAESATLLLLRHIARAAVHGLLVLGTARTVDRSEPEAFAQALADLSREHLLETVLLTGLDGDHVGALVTERLNRRSDPAFAAILQGETGGNPFFIHELLSHLTDRGLLRTTTGQWPTSAQVHSSGAPEGVNQVIEQRLHQLSTPARQILTAAAVAGLHFHAADVARAASKDLDLTLSALQQATTGGLVAENESEFGVYRFTHALVQHTLYNGTPVLRRAYLHWQIAEAISESSGASDRRLSALAYHSRCGLKVGNPSLAVQWLREAADEATRQLAFEEAIEHFGAAQDALALSPPALKPSNGTANRDGLACDLWLGLGGAYTGSGDWNSARTAFREAAISAMKLGDGERLGKAAIGYGGQWQGLVREDPVLEELLTQALAAAPAGRPDLQAKLMARLSQVVFVSGRNDDADTLTRQALECAEESRDPVAISWCLHARHFVRWRPSDAEDNLRIALRSQQLASEMNHLGRSQVGLWDQYIDELDLGRLKEAESTLDAYSYHANHGERPVDQWWDKALRACLHIARGHMDDAEQRARQAFDLGQALNPDEALLVYAVQLYIVRWHQGRITELLPEIEEFANAYPTLPAWRVALAVALIEGGSLERAADEVTRARPMIDSSKGDRYWLILQVLLGYAATSCCLESMASRAYELLVPFAGFNVVIGPGLATFGPVDRWLGQIAQSLGRTELATQHLTEAVRLADRWASPLWAAIGRLDLADVALRQRHADQARSLVKEAANAASSTDLASLKPRIEKVLHLILGDQPLFHVPAYRLVHPMEFGIYVILGVVGGLGSVCFVKLLLKLRILFKRLPASTVWLQPAAGGLLVGLLAGGCRKFSAWATTMWTACWGEISD